MRPKSSGSLANFMFLSQHYKLQKSPLFIGVLPRVISAGARPASQLRPHTLHTLQKKTIVNAKIHQGLTKIFNTPVLNLTEM